MPPTERTFPSPCGRLAGQQWIPAGTPRGDVVLVHGGGEHLGRYGHVATALSQAGYAVTLFDLPGHGRSPGIRGHITRFDDYLACVLAVLDAAPAARPVLLGHSLGGLIAAAFAARHPGRLQALALSSPFWGISIPVPAWKHRLAMALERGWPSLTFQRPRHASGSSALSHDPEVGRRYLADPLVHFRASARLYAETRRVISALPQLLPRLTMPVLVMAAGDDLIASAGAVRAMFPLIGSAEKRLMIYEGFYHEIFNEVEKSRVLADLIAWLDRGAASGRPEA